MLVSLATLPSTFPHGCNGSEGLATDREGVRKRITSQYLFPLAAWVETDTLHALTLFSLKPIQELYLCLGSGDFRGRLGISRHGEILNKATEEKVRV